MRDEDINMNFLPYQANNYMRKFLSELKKGSVSENHFCKSYLDTIVANIGRRLDLGYAKSCQFKMAVEDVAEAECLSSSLSLKNSRSGSAADLVFLSPEDDDERNKKGNQDENCDTLEIYEQMQQSVKQFFLKLKRKLSLELAELYATQQTLVKRGRGRPRKN
ncbi:hypothetical protein BGZ60DRAFT_426076 [Tricladium varicosporioides]|nr:hypothetical protein BGZ60DRAFT_426076 [Hymenoscyphus varicosporioides]